MKLFVSFASLLLLTTAASAQQEDATQPPVTQPKPRVRRVTSPDGQPVPAAKPSVAKPSVAKPSVAKPSIAKPRATEKAAVAPTPAKDDANGEPAAPPHAATTHAAPTRHAATSPHAAVTTHAEPPDQSAPDGQIPEKATPKPGADAAAGDAAPGDAAAAGDAAADTQASKPVPNIRGQLTTAGQLMVDGKYGEAADVFQQALTFVPNSVDALAGLGMALGRQQKLDEADVQFDKVLEIDQANAVAHCGKAMVSLSRLANVPESDKKARTALLRQAGRECNKALDADPRVVEAHYLLGKVYREEGRLDRAEQAFSGAVKLDPHYANAWAALGMAQVQDGKLSQAADNLKKATDISPHNSTAYFGLGQMYLKLGQVDRAVRELNMSIYNNPNHEPVHIALGKAYEVQGDNVAAVKAFQEAVRIKPDDPEAYLCLAGNFQARGDMESALAKLKQGLQVLPNDPGLHLAIADAGLKAGKTNQAILDYEVVLNAQPGNADAALGSLRAFYVRSLKESTGGYVRSADFDRAKSLIARAVQTDGTDLSVRYAAAGMSALAGQTPSLDQMGAPQTAADRIGLAEALLCERKFKDADDELRRVINNAANAREAFGLADLAISVSALDAAESAYRKALTFVNGDTRARLGLDAISKIRQQARDDYSQGDELLKRRAFIQSAEKFRSAVFGDPRNAEARRGLAESLERLTFTQPVDTARNYREAIHQYRVYLQLTPSIPVKVQEKFTRKITKLDEQARKLEGPKPEGPKSASDRVSTSLNQQSDAKVAPAPRD